MASDICSSCVLGSLGFRSPNDDLARDGDHKT
jgi:hypothetical protein